MNLARRKKKEVRAYPCSFVELNNTNNPLMLATRNEFKGKTVIVSGASGFIGKALTYALLRCGAKVYGASSGKRSEEDIFWTHLVKNWKYDPLIDKEVAELNSFTWDMTIPSYIEAVFPKPDYIFHLGAVIGGIKEIHDKAARILQDNTKMIFNLYDSVKRYSEPYPKIIIFSTCTVFEKLQDRPFNEEDLQDIPPPSLDYAFQKLFCEQFARCMWNTHKIPYNIVRPFNTYGPGECSIGNYGRLHVVPDMIQKVDKVRKGETNTVQIFGNGEQLRSYTYIEDLVMGILAAAAQPGCDAYNVTRLDTHSVIDIITEITKAMGLSTSSVNIEMLPSISGDVKKRMPSHGKLHELGWKPLTSFKKGIKETVKWTDEVIANDGPKT